MQKVQEPNFRWGYAIFVLILLSILGFIAVGILSLFVGVDVESLSGNVALIHIEGVIVATQDVELKKRLKNKPIITLRQKNHLVLLNFL